MTRWTWRGAAITLCLGCSPGLDGNGPTARGSNGPVPQATERLAELQVQLGQDCMSVAGLDWPMHGTRPSELKFVQSPRAVTIRVPGRVLLACRSQATALEQSGGRVRYVRLLPLPEAVPLPDAMASLEKELGKLPGEKVAAMATRLRGLAGDPSRTKGPAAAFFDDTEVSDETKVAVEVKKNVDTEDWYYVIAFRVR